MSLRADADHFRKMSTAEHLPECSTSVQDRWGWMRLVRPDPACEGCVTDADRDLWTRLAAEIDEHLAAKTETTLFGDEAEEPAATNDPERQEF